MIDIDLNMKLGLLSTIGWIILAFAFLGCSTFLMEYEIWAQLTTLTSPSGQSKEGGSPDGQKLGLPTFNPSRASSSLPPSLTVNQKENLSNFTEAQTFSKPITPFTNQSIAPPPAVNTQTNITNSTTIYNNNIDTIHRSLFQTNQNVFFHRIASFLDTTESTKKFNIMINKTVIPSNVNDYSTLPFIYRNEPSVANNGQIIFYVGNFYAARSTDAGNTFKFYPDPVKATDQLVIYDNIHHIFIWYQQGFPDNFGKNKVYINISHDALNWWTYVIDSSTLFGPSWKDKKIDFPHLALTKNSLYYASNIMEPTGAVNNNNRTFIAKISLDDLANGRNPSFSYYFSDSLFNFTPVQGATDTMYWATHISNQRMAIYKWNDSEPASKVIKTESDIPSWTPSGIAYSCPTSDNDYCSNADDRITTGWISDGKVGWMWNVDKGGGFKWPYVNSAIFQADNMSYLGRPLIWSNDFALLYPFIAVDQNGNLGLVVSFGGNKTNPSIGVAYVANHYDTVPPWPIVPVVFGGKPEPFSNQWGDFITIQPYKTNSNESKFIASGFTIEGTGNMTHVAPHLIVFGK
jgi:hypothetical protein